jgi:protein TonB
VKATKVAEPRSSSPVAAAATNAAAPAVMAGVSPQRMTLPTAQSVPVPAVSAAMTAPQAISKIAPDYPPQARRRKVEGFVELEFRVATSGNAEDIRVLRSEPEGLFDRNAVRALMRWKFKPAERNGVPEAATTRTTMNFRQS